MGVGPPANFLTDNHDVKSGRSIALYTLLCIIWGSTWLVIKVGYGGLGPFNVAALRFFLAGAVLVPLVPLFGARWPRGRDRVGAGHLGRPRALRRRLRPDLLGRAVPRQRAHRDYLRHAADHHRLRFAHFYLPGDRLTAAEGWRRAARVRRRRRTVWRPPAPRRLGSRSRCSPSWPARCAPAPRRVATKRHGGALHPAALNAPAMLVGAVALLAASLAAGDGFRIPARRAHVGRHRLPRDRGQRGDVPRLFLAAQDVERHEPELHQRLHARDRARVSGSCCSTSGRRGSPRSAAASSCSACSWR